MHSQSFKSTALEGEGQQCKAAPACTASIEPDANGSLETSALTRARFLLIGENTLPHGE